MSMFSKLVGRILGKKEQEILSPGANSSLVLEAGAGGEGAKAMMVAPAGSLMIDVEANLAAMASGNSEELDWKRSIVDLLKLVKMDSSYGARKQIALELGYTQDQIDCKGSGEMNIWLHTEVMRRLVENGGRIPDGLLD